MNDVVAVELAAGIARALALRAWTARPHATFETSWDPARPEDLVAALQRQFGPTRRIALAIGLGFLHVKHAKLPPAPLLERRRMLALEPDRFFAVQDTMLVISVVAERDLAFALDQDLLARWLGAFESWAPVDNVEPAPAALARAGGSGTSGTFALPAGDGEHGVVEIENGRLASARRIPALLTAPETQPLPRNRHVAVEFLVALGAAQGVTGDIDAMLLPDAGTARVRRRRSARLAFSALACLLAFSAAVWAVDRSRARTLHRIDAEIAALSRRAAPALVLRDSLATSTRAAGALRTIAARRQDPLPVLAALSAQLPPGATVLNFRAAGKDWQIDGTAQDAAGIVAALARDGRFQDVRFVSASSRFREQNRTYETFSIAFRIRPDA